MATLGEISVQERKALDTQLQLYHDEEVWLDTFFLSEKTKQKDVIFCLTKNRIIILHCGGKLHSQFHLFEITEIISNSPFELTINTRKQRVDTHEPTAPTVAEILTRLYQHWINCGIASHFPISGLSEERLQSLQNQAKKVNSSTLFGFTAAYQSYANLNQIMPYPEVIWDLENLYPANSKRSLDLSELNQRANLTGTSGLSAKEIKTIIQALQRNRWFTELIIVGLHLDKDSLIELVELFKTNQTLEVIKVEDCLINSEHMQGIVGHLSTNEVLRTKICTLSFCDNFIVDKGLQFLNQSISQFTNLKSLNVSKGGITAKAMSELFEVLMENPACVKGLEFLSVGQNKFDKHTCENLGNLLSKCHQLKELNLSHCDIDYAQLRPAKSAKLAVLDISENKISLKEKKHFDLFTFLRNLPALTSLNMAHTGLAPDVFEPLLDVLPLVKVLNLSSNSFGDEGVITLCGQIEKMKSLTDLNLSYNFDKPTKYRTTAVNELAKIIGQNTLENLQSLALAGNAKNPLKKDIMPLIYALMTNSTLTKLDVSGNYVGLPLAVGLSKVFSVNSTLASISLDENQVPLSGFNLLKLGLKDNTSLVEFHIPAQDMQLLTKDTKNVVPLLSVVKEIQEAVMVNINGLRQQVMEKPMAKNESPPMSSRSLKMQESDLIDFSDVLEVPQIDQQGVRRPAAKLKKEKATKIDTLRAANLFGNLQNYQVGPPVSAEEIQKVIAKHKKKH